MAEIDYNSLTTLHIQTNTTEQLSAIFNAIKDDFSSLLIIEQQDLADNVKAIELPISNTLANDSVRLLVLNALGEALSQKTGIPLSLQKDEGSRKLKITIQSPTP